MHYNLFRCADPQYRICLTSSSKVIESVQNKWIKLILKWLTNDHINWSNFQPTESTHYLLSFNPFSRPTFPVNQNNKSRIKQNVTQIHLAKNRSYSNKNKTRTFNQVHGQTVLSQQKKKQIYIYKNIKMPFHWAARRWSRNHNCSKCIDLWDFSLHRLSSSSAITLWLCSRSNSYINKRSIWQTTQ